MVNGTKKVAIMQPYFIPYIAYFQLIKAVDIFVIYDDLQYSKGGWINRNRILLNGEPSYISLPLKKGSDYLNINERYLSDDFEKTKMLNRIKNLYKKSPYFDQTFELVNDIFSKDEKNLFKFLHNCILKINEYLDIKTQIIFSSQVNDHENYKKNKKVIYICKTLKASNYINPIGGLELYDKEDFKSNKINLEFLKMKPLEYDQFRNDFVKDLSIIDVLMFNSKKTVKEMLNEYSLI